MWNDRRVGIGLAASLLLNVFLLGVVLGRGGLFEHRRPPAPPSAGPIVPARTVETLPEDQKKLFQAAMLAHREAIRGARRGHRERRQKVEEDIAAPNFDRAVLEADLAALRLSNTGVEEATGAALVDAVAGLSPAARAALVARPAAKP